MATEEIRMKAIRAIRGEIGTEEIILKLDREGLLAGAPEHQTWSDHCEFVNQILENAPQSWDGDEAAESIALEYVRALETRVQELGGSLERYPSEPEDTEAPGQQTLF